jgi:hypothetical protein
MQGSDRGQLPAVLVGDGFADPLELGAGDHLGDAGQRLGALLARPLGVRGLHPHPRVVVRTRFTLRVSWPVMRPRRPSPADAIQTGVDDDSPFLRYVVRATYSSAASAVNSVPTKVLARR